MTKGIEEPKSTMDPIHIRGHYTDYGKDIHNQVKPIIQWIPAMAKGIKEPRPGRGEEIKKRGDIRRLLSKQSTAPLKHT